MKWLIGVGLVIASPFILSGLMLWGIVYKLPMHAYELASELWKLK